MMAGMASVDHEKAAEIMVGAVLRACFDKRLEFPDDLKQNSRGQLVLELERPATDGIHAPTRIEIAYAARASDPLALLNIVGVERSTEYHLWSKFDMRKQVRRGSELREDGYSAIELEMVTQLVLEAGPPA